MTRKIAEAIAEAIAQNRAEADQAERKAWAEFAESNGPKEAQAYRLSLQGWRDRNPEAIAEAIAQNASAETRAAAYDVVTERLAGLRSARIRADQNATLGKWPAAERIMQAAERLAAQV